MHVLVVDDDRTTRFLLKRALTQRFGCAVTEACDGNEALSALAGHRYDLAILDVQMPVVDGLETLRTLRRSEEQAGLPVVMLTGERDEAIVREILELGVLEYMTKPLNIPRLSERLGRVLRCVGWEGPAPDSTSSPLAPGASAPLLIVEGDRAFREFFVETLGTRRPVIQAGTGVGAMRDCVVSGPAAVFVGRDIGVLNEALLVKRIRANPLLKHLPLVAIADDETAAAARSASYDGTIPRSFVPEVLLEKVQALARRGIGPIADVINAQPGLRAALILAGEQELASILSTEMMLRDTSDAATGEWTLVGATAALSERRSMTVQLACDAPTSRRMAANTFGTDLRLVRDEDVDGALVRAFAGIRSRIVSTFAGNGLEVTFDEPATRRHRGTVPAAGGPAGVAMFFQSTTGDLQFWLLLDPVGGRGQNLMLAPA